MSGCTRRSCSDMVPVREPLLAGNALSDRPEFIVTGWMSSAGSYIERFEQDWAAYCGRRHGIALASGTAALQIAVDALRLGPGDEVVMPSFTIISCPLAVVRAGATPVLVDSDPETWCLDLDQVAAAITPRTRAIMPVHIYGHPVDMDPLLELAQRHGLAVIEDAAEAHGCEYFSRRAAGWSRCGSLGTLSAFSFYANKLVTTGEGGMVLTDSEALAERCRSLRNLCFAPRRFQHEDCGYNYRLTNMQAAVGVAQVERIADMLERKRCVGARYDELLADVPGIRLPARRQWARINCWMYGIVLEDEVAMDAVEFAACLKAGGVDTRPFFLGMHKQPVFCARGLFEGMRLPVAERLHRRGICLPSGPTLTPAQVENVAATVRDVVGFATQRRVMAGQRMRRRG